MQGTSAHPAGTTPRACSKDSWSCRHIGTFPTYTLGNAMAAQFFAAAERRYRGWHGKFGQADRAAGSTTDNLYRHGRAPPTNCSSGARGQARNEAAHEEASALPGGINSGVNQPPTIHPGFCGRPASVRRRGGVQAGLPTG